MNMFEKLDKLMTLLNAIEGNPSTPPPTPTSSHPWELGKNYLIRTVTMINTGRLVGVYPQELVLEDAAWIANTGRFATALASSEFEEVEPFPAGHVVVVGRAAVIDAVQIKTLPRAQK